MHADSHIGRTRAGRTHTGALVGPGRRTHASPQDARKGRPYYGRGLVSLARVLRKTDVSMHKGDGTRALVGTSRRTHASPQDARKGRPYYGRGLVSLARVLRKTAVSMHKGDGTRALVGTSRRTHASTQDAREPAGRTQGASLLWTGIGIVSAGPAVNRREHAQGGRNPRVGRHIPQDARKPAGRTQGASLLWTGIGCGISFSAYPNARSA